MYSCRKLSRIRIYRDLFWLPRGVFQSLGSPKQVQVKEAQPLSRRMRINIAAASNAVHAAPHAATPSVRAFIVFLDWFGEPPPPTARALEGHLLVVSMTSIQG